MVTLLKRHEIQVLLNAGHSQAEVACLAKVSERSVRRIAAEAAVEQVDDHRERVQRRIGRPSKVDRFRPLVEQLLQETDEDRAPLKSVEILRRARLDGYDGGKTALYEVPEQRRQQKLERPRPLRTPPERLAGSGERTELHLLLHRRVPRRVVAAESGRRRAPRRRLMMAAIATEDRRCLGVLGHHPPSENVSESRYERGCSPTRPDSVPENRRSS